MDKKHVYITSGKYFYLNVATNSNRTFVTSKKKPKQIVIKQNITVACFIAIEENRGVPLPALIAQFHNSRV